MVPASWVALLVLLVTVLPGAMFTFGFERRAGDFGVALADRVLRFVATSVVLDLALAWPAYALYRAGARPPPWDVAEFTTAWSAVLLGSALPFAAGSALGGLYATRGSRSGWRLLRRVLTPEREARLRDLVVGRDPAPRGWDFYFSQKPVAYLRVRTRDGRGSAGCSPGSRPPASSRRRATCSSNRRGRSMTPACSAMLRSVTLCTCGRLDLVP